MQRKFIIWKLGPTPTGKGKHYLGDIDTESEDPVYFNQLELGRRFDSYNEAQGVIPSLGRGIYGIKSIYVNY